LTVVRVLHAGDDAVGAVEDADTGPRLPADAGMTELRTKAPAPREVTMLMVAMSFFMLLTLTGVC
jgi:hypothetical protein